MRFFRFLILTVLLLAIAGAGAMWFLSSREAGPAITIHSPEKYIGRSTPLAVSVASETELAGTAITVEQNGKAIALPDLKMENPAAGQMNASATIGREGLVNGPATLVVEASRKVLFGLRTVSSRATRDLVVRLDPPRVSVVSIHHFINLGGAEFVVLRATPEDVEAGVQAGDTKYPFYPGSAVGLTDPAMRVGFFALRHDQDVNARITAYARDAAGNEAMTPLEHQPFVKKFVQSKIPIDQKFLDRVVPAIASNTPDIKVDTGSPEGLLKGFLEINGNLRKKNGDFIASLAAKSAPKMLWTEAFAQMSNSQVESRFADRRTYYFEDKEIDKQVHLGFDLATVQQAPVHASNAGVVVFGDFLGIYGNCVIVDHGLGVQSLYAHLSHIGVKVGDSVTKGQELGRTGSTGLAGGDHLHFTMLLQGTPVNPVEWWDPHWLQDRVNRKITEAGGPKS
ncbi:MAG TPA: M23 family metallopeptidase [Vicinamibacterales bacterium]|nr:M23 family metallopeptidase [Vicinamibacterales bacterium]